MPAMPPVVLSVLPDPVVPDNVCPKRSRQQLDLLLLAIEALDLGGSEAFLIASKELGLQEIVKNRVSLWRIRATNPLRRNSQRRSLSLEEAKALTFIICHLSKRLTVLLRELLFGYDQLLGRQMAVENFPRLAYYLERFRSHYRARMNPKRSQVMAHLENPEALDQMAIALLAQLLFCTGTAGTQRLWSSLFDGEVS
jgi:Protein of unknown function (DUF3038)